MSWEPSDQVQPKVTSRKSSVCIWLDAQVRSNLIANPEPWWWRQPPVAFLSLFSSSILFLCSHYESLWVIMSHYESRPQAVVHHGLSICHKQALFENPPRSHFWHQFNTSCFKAIGCFRVTPISSSKIWQNDEAIENDSWDSSLPPITKPPPNKKTRVHLQVWKISDWPIWL